MLSITRRDALRVVLTSTIALASSALAGGPLVLTSRAGSNSALILLGVRIGRIPAGDRPGAVPLVLQSMDAETGLMRSVEVPQVLQDGVTPVLSIGETLTAWTALADGTFLLATTPVLGSRHTTDSTRLTWITSTGARALLSRGLSPQDQLSSIVPMLDGTLIALAGKRNGRPPQRLVTIDPATATATEFSGARLAMELRFTTLAQSHDGQLYATSVSEAGDTSLVQLSTRTSRPLTLNGVVWNSGFSSLVFSPMNQLFALGAPRYTWPNQVYVVDAAAGVLTPVRAFDVARVSIARV